MPALYRVPILVDQASAELLTPWLDSGTWATTSPAVKVHIASTTGGAQPAFESVVETPTFCIGKAAEVLLVTDRLGSWFTVEPITSIVRGTLSRAPASSDDPGRDVLYRALLIALTAMGVYDLHAAAICTAERAFVLVGDSGAGKSTTATALLSAGCRYLGDDEVLIHEHAGAVELLAFSPSFRLTDSSLTTFAALRPHASKPNPEAKWSIDASVAFPGRHLAEWRGATTLLFLENSSERASTLCALPVADAVGHLIAQSSALGVECHPTPRQHLRLLARLAGQSQIARLALGGEWLIDPVGSALRLIEQERKFFSSRTRPSPG